MEDRSTLARRVVGVAEEQLRGGHGFQVANPSHQGTVKPSPESGWAEPPGQVLP